MFQHDSSVEQSVGGVLAPVSLEDFFADYWEQKPLHIGRESANPFEHLISIEDIELLLSTHQINFPTVQLSHAGNAIAPEEYTDENGRIVSNRIIERYYAGSTIVVSFAHRLNANLMALCRKIEKSLMMRCQTNVYLSPAGNQGFNPHFDTHDVFILQVSGRKTFNFYSSVTRFPISANRFNRDVHAIGEKTEEIQLGAGDTLYIPRGFVHDAVADNEEPSLHVTVGVYPVLLHTLVEEVMQIAQESDPRLRRAISQPLWLQNEHPTNTIRLIKEVIQDQLTESAFTEALERLRDEFVLDTTMDCQGALSASATTELIADSVLIINHGSVLNVHSEGAQLTLHSFGQITEFKEPLSSAVHWLLQRDKVVLRDIPDLELEQQLALAQRLRLIGIVGVP